MSQLILPGHPLFTPTLVNIPFYWKQLQREKCDYFTYIPDLESGVLEAATPERTREFLLGGEADWLVDQQAEWDECERLFQEEILPNYLVQKHLQCGNPSD